MVMSRDPGFIFRKFLFYFLPNSILNFRKSYQIWGKLAQEQKSYKLGGGKGPLSAYRVKEMRLYIKIWNEFRNI